MEQTVGIIGLGTMGLGIAQVFAVAGFAVLATDGVEGARAQALGRMRRALQGRVDKGAMTVRDMDAAMGRVQVVGGVQELAGADLVIEAIAEDLAAKRAVFAALGASDAVLATNTSSLSVASVAAGTRRPERVVGLHFFNPAPAMKLVELVRHPGSSEAALDLARVVTEAAGKTVVTCADTPGFIVNRCARPFYGEALALLEEGRTAGEIDAAMIAAGFRIGPFALIDLIGADINLAATRGVQAALRHPRYHVFDRLAAQVASGDLGRKTGRGFVFPDPAIPAPPDADLMARRIEATLANEAGWLLAEGGVSAVAIDTALRLGLNFPRGPIEGGLALGAGQVRAILAGLEAAAPPHLRGRYLPAPLWA